MPVTRRLSNDYERIHNNCIKGLIEYLNGYPNLKSTIVGISGGIDSALVCALVGDALTELKREVKLIGYSLPIYTNDSNEIGRANLVGESFCDYYDEVQMAPVMPSLIKTMDNSLLLEWTNDTNKTPLATLIRVGNIKARLRMMYLYDKASKYNGMVLSTDNYTEYLLGFWTLHGDVGDYGLIQNLWKTEVYGLAEWMVTNRGITALAEVIDAKPTDGLGVNDDGDIGQLMPDWEGSHRNGYEFIDNLLIAIIEGDSCVKVGETELTSDTLFDHKVLRRYAASHFKRENPTNISRRSLMEGIV